MPIIKPKFDGSEDIGDGRYTGPPPTPGPYRGNVRGMWLTTIKSGDNAGEDQIVVSVKINHGKFKGASILHNLQIMKATSWSTNQFLHALTDGSEKQKSTLRKWFWQIGYDVEDHEEKLGRPIIKIGKNFKPIDREIGFIVKKDTYNGEDRAKIDRFVVPLEDSEDEAADEDDGIGEFDAATTHNPEPVKVAAVPEPEMPPSESDDDDPWS